MNKNTPKYYKITEDLDVFDMCHKLQCSFQIACAFKYLVRDGKKEGSSREEDRIKARNCIDRAILYEKNESEDTRYVDLRKADLRKANLSGANLRKADLRDVDLRVSDLRDVDLRLADLRNADLRKTDLRDADLRGVSLAGAYMRKKDLSDVNFDEEELL
jgi:uncharacterized protein YjbI with pentapeptide repeats